MTFLNSILKNSKKYDFPFDHWEYSNALSDSAIEEIITADIPDVSKHNLNYDGTPISWVLRVERVLLETSYDILEDELLRNSFISFEDGNFILIGPYIDRSQLLLAQDYLNEKYGKDLGVIEKWQI